MVELVVLGATVALVAGASAFDALRRASAEATLRGYAISRGHRFGAGERRAGPHAWGTRENVAFTIDYCKLRGELRTRVRASATKGGGLRVSIVQRGAWARALGATGEASVGDAVFDDAYWVRGVEPDDARTLLGECVAPLGAMAARAGVCLASDGATVALTWRGVERSPAVLDAAVAAVVAAAAWHRPARPYR